MYFFFHLTNRLAFAQLGHEKRNKLYDELIPPTIDATIRTLFVRLSRNSEDEIKKNCYDGLNTTEMMYGSCEKLLLEHDTPSLVKMESGAKSKSMVGIFRR